MSGKKKCPVCGLVQPAGTLDCASCATSLIDAAPTEDPAEEDLFDLQSPATESAEPPLAAPGKGAGQDPGNGSPAPVSARAPKAPAARPEAVIIFQGADGKRIKARSGDILGRDFTGAEYFNGFPKVSRQHAKVTREEEGWVIEDLNSVNGVYVDGERRTRAPLEPGDSFALSKSCELTVASC